MEFSKRNIKHEEIVFLSSFRNTHGSLAEAVKKSCETYFSFLQASPHVSIK